MSNIAEYFDKEVSFWSKREGKITMILLGIGAVALVPFINVILTGIITLLLNGITGLFLLGVLLAMVFLATNKQVRMFVSVLWGSTIRALFGWVVTLDPFGIMQEQIDDAEQEMIKIEKDTNKVAGGKEQVLKQINSNIKTIENKLREAETAKKMMEKHPSNSIERLELEGAYNLALQEAGGLKDMNERLNPLLNSIEFLIGYLEKVLKDGQFKIASSKIELKHLKIEYDVVKSGHSAMSSAMRMLKGDPDKKQMLENAVSFVNQDMANKLGEMKRGIQASREIMVHMDIERGVFTSKGESLLNELKEKSKIVIPEARVIPNTQLKAETIPAAKTSYRNLLED